MSNTNQLSVSAGVAAQDIQSSQSDGLVCDMIKPSNSKVRIHPNAEKGPTQKRTAVIILQATVPLNKVNEEIRFLMALTRVYLVRIENQTTSLRRM